MNYVLNQNWKGQEETQVDIYIFQFRCCENNIEALPYFKMTLPFFQVLQKSPPHSSVTLSHTIESIMNDSVGQDVT